MPLSRIGPSLSSNPASVAKRMRNSDQMRSSGHSSSGSSGASAREEHVRTIGGDLADAHRLGSKQNLAAGSQSESNQIFDDLLLAVDRDGAAPTQLNSVS